MEIPNDKIPCNICGRDDSARIREIELSVARHTLRAHVDCDFGHGQYRRVQKIDVARAQQAALARNQQAALEAAKGE